MGSFFSSPLAHEPLVGPLKPVAAIDSRFCAPVSRTVQFPRHAWLLPPGDRVVKDVRTGKEYFNFGGNSAREGVLQDDAHESLAFIHREKGGIKSLVNASTDPQGHHEFMTIRTRPSTKASRAIQIRFQNVSTGKDCDLGVELDLTSAKMILWMDELATQGAKKRIPIAHIQDDPDQKVPKAQMISKLTVAPHVDMAMVMVVLLALMT